jgi:hypothetical protein
MTSEPSIVPTVARLRIVDEGPHSAGRNDDIHM